MSLRRRHIGIAVLLILLGLQQACDFRQMIEERPVKLPDESRDPKKTHAAGASQSAVPDGAARTR